MTERDEGGRFAANPDRGFGIQENLERDLGFAPMRKEPEESEPTFGSDQESLQQAAAELRERREADEGGYTKRQYLDAEGNPLSEVSDDLTSEKPNGETVTLDDAAKDLAELRAAEDTTDKTADEEFAKEIDKLRGIEPKTEVKAKTEQPAEQTAETPVEPVQNTADEARLQGEFETARAVMLTAMLAQLPELANTAQSEWPGIIAQWQATGDPKFQKAMELEYRSGQLIQAATQAQEKHVQERSVADRKTFETFAKVEDAKFAAKIANESPETQRAVQQRLLSFFGDRGVGSDIFLNAYQTDPIMRSAAGQEFMYQAAKAMIELEQIKAAKANIVAKHNLPPPPIRPGPAGVTPRANSNDARIADLSRRLSGASGREALAIASQITSLRRKG